MAFATYPSLKARVVFVTGGASGIGASLVEQFHAQGAKVAFVDLQAEAGKRMASKLPGAWFRAVDVTDTSALLRAIADGADALGPVTILVNNVADDTRHVAAETSAEAWRAGLAVNLDPVFVASTAVYPMMRQAGGGAIDRKSVV